MAIVVDELEELIKDNLDAIYRMALFMTMDKSEAERVVLSMCVSLYITQPIIHSKAQLFGILRRGYVNAIRYPLYEYLEALNLWCVEGFTYREIASITGSTIDIVNSRIYWAMKLFS